MGVGGVKVSSPGGKKKKKRKKTFPSMRTSERNSHGYGGRKNSLKGVMITTYVRGLEERFIKVGKGSGVTLTRGDPNKRTSSFCFF